MASIGVRKLTRTVRDAGIKPRQAEDSLSWKCFCPAAAGSQSGLDDNKVEVRSTSRTLFQAPRGNIYMLLLEFHCVEIGT